MNGRKCIEGTTGFSASEYASSLHGSQARILQTLAEDLGYDDLLCYSGFAFRIGIHQEMCPSAGHPCCGYMCLDGSNRALPWKVRLFEALPWGDQRDDRAAFETEVCSAIKDSIDRGVPVHHGSEEDGLIIGYADDGRRWWCVHPYHQDGNEAFWHDEVEGFAGGKWPWGIVVWTEPKPDPERVSRQDLTVAALHQAVEMWKAEKHDAYFVGEAAYTHWLGWLGCVEAGQVNEPQAGMQGNGWCYDVLIHSRRIAGRWLRQRADESGGEAARELLTAAHHYTQIAESLLDGLDCPWDLALRPDRQDAWTSEMRRSQIARLEVAREHEGAAVSAICRAFGLRHQGDHRELS